MGNVKMWPLTAIQLEAMRAAKELGFVDKEDAEWAENIIFNAMVLAQNEGSRAGIEEAAKVCDGHFRGWSPTTWNEDQIVRYAKRTASEIRALLTEKPHG